MVWLVVWLVGHLKHARIQHGLCYFIITVATRKMAQTWGVDWKFEHPSFCSRWNLYLYLILDFGVWYCNYSLKLYLDNYRLWWHDWMWCIFCILWGGGNFVPLKHYDPDDEEDLLNKYFPKKLKTKKVNQGEVRLNQREKGKKKHFNKSLSLKMRHNVYMPAHNQKHQWSQQGAHIDKAHPRRDQWQMQGTNWWDEILTDLY